MSRSGCAGRIWRAPRSRPASPAPTSSNARRPGRSGAPFATRKLGPARDCYEDAKPRWRARRYSGRDERLPRSALPPGNPSVGDDIHRAVLIVEIVIPDKFIRPTSRRWRIAQTHLDQHVRGYRAMTAVPSAPTPRGCSNVGYRPHSIRGTIASVIRNLACAASTSVARTSSRPLTR